MLKTGLFSPGYHRVRAYFRDQSKLVYVRGQRGNQPVRRSGAQYEPRFMDFTSLFYSHVEAFAERSCNPNADSYLHIGFNTGSPGGCYLVNRRKRDSNAIANHLASASAVRMKKSRLNLLLCFKTAYSLCIIFDP